MMNPSLLLVKVSPPVMKAMTRLKVFLHSVIAFLWRMWYLGLYFYHSIPHMWEKFVHFINTNKNKVIALLLLFNKHLKDLVIQLVRGRPPEPEVVLVVSRPPIIDNTVHNSLYINKPSFEIDDDTTADIKHIRKRQAAELGTMHQRNKASKPSTDTYPLYMLDFQKPDNFNREWSLYEDKPEPAVPQTYFMPSSSRTPSPYFSPMAYSPYSSSPVFMGSRASSASPSMRTTSKSAFRRTSSISPVPSVSPFFPRSPLTTSPSPTQRYSSGSGSGSEASIEYGL